jgi:hypothetical protein
VEFVGHELTQEGNMPAESKDALLNHWTPPTTIRDVSSFLRFLFKMHPTFRNQSPEFKEKIIISKTQNGPNQPIKNSKTSGPRHYQNPSFDESPEPSIRVYKPISPNLVSDMCCSNQAMTSQALQQWTEKTLEDLANLTQLLAAFDSSHVHSAVEFAEAQNTISSVLFRQSNSSQQGRNSQESSSTLRNPILQHWRLRRHQMDHDLQRNQCSNHATSNGINELVVHSHTLSQSNAHQRRLFLLPQKSLQCDPLLMQHMEVTHAICMQNKPDADGPEISPKNMPNYKRKQSSPITSTESTASVNHLTLKSPINLSVTDVPIMFAISKPTQPTRLHHAHHVRNLHTNSTNKATSYSIGYPRFQPHEF